MNGVVFTLAWSTHYCLGGSTACNGLPSKAESALERIRFVNTGMLSVGCLLKALENYGRRDVELYGPYAMLGL